MLGMRLTFIGAAALLTAGGSVASNQPHLGKWLSLAGYILFAVTLGITIALELFFLMKRGRLISSSRRVSIQQTYSDLVADADNLTQVLYGSLLAAPFIVLRCIYGILGVVYGLYSTLWSPVFGNVVAFALMGLLCEYIAICIWLYIGFSMPPDRGVRAAPNRNAPQQKETV
jgi:hypothetical protein